MGNDTSEYQVEGYPRLLTVYIDLLPYVYLGNTFGAVFIGAALAAILFGVSNLQAFIYFQTHRDTGMTFFKLVVIGLWTMDALHLALVIHCVYYYLVTNYANFDALTEIVWSGKLQMAVLMFTIWCIHLLYVYRIWIVSTGRSRTLPIIVGIMVILYSSAPIVVTFEVYKCRLFTDVIVIEWASVLGLSMTTFIDFVIAASLCYLLAKSHTGFSNTDTLLTKLMVFTIHAGCLTSICSLAALTASVLMPGNLIYVAIEFLMTKLYINSFLALMNARYYLRSKDTVPIHISEFRACHLSLHSGRKSKTGDLQESQMNVFKHPHDEELRPTHSMQTVMTNSFSSV